MIVEKYDNIIVKSQSELDGLAQDFPGRIFIGFGTLEEPAVIAREFYHPVETWGSHYIIARGNSSVILKQDSRAKAYDNSRIQAAGNSYVKAYDDVCVLAINFSYVECWGYSFVEARDNARIKAEAESCVIACGSSYIIASNKSYVEAYDNSYVIALRDSRVKAYNNSYVVAKGSSYVTAHAASQVVDQHSDKWGKIEIKGNARVVKSPKTVYDFMDFHNIEYTDTKATFYKNVRKTDSAYESRVGELFEYDINLPKGENATIYTSPNIGSTINIYSLHDALCRGRVYQDVVILEVEVCIEDIVMRPYSDGGVTAYGVKVIRELALEDCGIFGKIAAAKCGVLKEIEYIKTEGDYDDCDED